MSAINTIATYWTVFIWGIGAAATTLALLLALQMAAWKLYKEIVGWPIIVKAVREYHEKQLGETK